MSTRINLRNPIIGDVRHRQPKKPFPWVVVIMLLGLAGLVIIMTPLIIKGVDNKPER